MSVSDELITQFVKATYDGKDTNTETTHYGTVVEDGSQLYVRLDGSDVLTPILTTTEIQPGERVVVTIRNHTATVMGNLDNPAFGTKSAGSLTSTIEQTAEAIRLEVADGDAQLKSLIEQTAGSIRSEVSDVDAQLKSQIEQTADSIRSEVSDGDAELKSQIEQTASEINQTISNNHDEFTTFKQTVDGWEFVDENGSIIIENGSIKWEYLANDAQTKVTDAQSTADSASTAASNAQSTANSASTAASNAQSTANSAYNLASSVNSAVKSWTYSDSTYIDGTKIMTGTVYASYLKGGVIYIMNSDDTITATMSPGATTSAGLDITSKGNLFLNSPYASFLFTSEAAYVSAANTTAKAFCPSGTQLSLGHSSYGTWGTLYASSCTCCTSDENHKHDIKDLPDKYVAMLDMVEPKLFKMDDGTSGRDHSGFIAQNVKTAMDANGIDSTEFGGWVKDVDADGNEIQMLRYEEFIAILHAKNCQQDAEIAALKSEVAELKAMVNALIESKEN